MIFANCWLQFAPTRKRITWVLAATMILLYLVNSPILILSLLVSAGFYLQNRSPRLRTYLILATVFAALVAVSYEKVEKRFEDVFDQDLDTIDVNESQVLSSKIPDRFPFSVAVDALRSDPINGLGIGGKRSLGDVSSLSIGWEYAFGNNNVATLFIYFGVVGAAILVGMLHRYLARNVLSIRHVWMITIALSLSLGGFESPRFWGYIFTALLAVRSSEQRQASDNGGMTVHVARVTR